MKRVDPIRLPLSLPEAEQLRDLLRRHTDDGVYAVLYYRFDRIIQRRKRRDEHSQQTTIYIK